MLGSQKQWDEFLDQTQAEWFLVYISFSSENDDTIFLQTPKTLLTLYSFTTHMREGRVLARPLADVFAQFGYLQHHLDVVNLSKSTIWITS